jgi:hypothetical protein
MGAGSRGLSAVMMSSSRSPLPDAPLLVVRDVNTFRLIVHPTCVIKPAVVAHMSPPTAWKRLLVKGGTVADLQQKNKITWPF